MNIAWFKLFLGGLLILLGFLEAGSATPTAGNEPADTGQGQGQGRKSGGGRKTGPVKIVETGEHWKEKVGVSVGGVVDESSIPVTARKAGGKGGGGGKRKSYIEKSEAADTSSERGAEGNGDPSDKSKVPASARKAGGGRGGGGGDKEIQPLKELRKLGKAEGGGGGKKVKTKPKKCSGDEYRHVRSNLCVPVACPRSRDEYTGYCLTRKGRIIKGTYFRG